MIKRKHFHSTHHMPYTTTDLALFCDVIATIGASSTILIVAEIAVESSL